jgi:ubiquinone/menaquinone biosynthesis C-methylase UbiE
VGNPFSLFPIQPGSVILDVGCGAGFELYIAARLTGPAGRVHGVDLTEAMVARARENLEKAGIENADVQKVGSESMPFEDNIFDMVISNGVINLSPEKESLFREINRGAGLPSPRWCWSMNCPRAWQAAPKHGRNESAARSRSGTIS